MERKHKIYFIISGIAYLILFFAFEINHIKSYALVISQIYGYSQFLILVIAFIFGIRNSVRAIVIWLGFLCGDFLYHLYRAILSIDSLNLVSFFYFALITVAFVYGFKSLNLKTVSTDNFSKMYRKPAVAFFVCTIIYLVIFFISSIDDGLTFRDEMSPRMLHLFVYCMSLILVIKISAVIYAISKIMKREVLGFVFAAVLLVWIFDHYITYFLNIRLFYSTYNALKNDVFEGNPILSLPSKIVFEFGTHIIVFMFLFSLILLINFLFYLKRDPK